MRDGLKDAHRRAIIDVLAANDRVERAVLYGSRATGTNTVTSDVDVALFGDRLTLTDRARLSATIDKIPMAQSVDLILYDSVRDGSLREHVRKQGIEWYVRGVERGYVVIGRAGSPGHDWSRVRLGDVVDVHKEQVRPLAAPDQVFAHHSIPAFDAGRTPVRELGEGIKSNKFTIPSGALLISRLNPRFPRVWATQVESEPAAICSTEFLVVQPHSVDRRFLQFVCVSPDFRSAMLARVTGTSGSHQRVPPAAALEIDIPLPPLPEQRAIAHVLATLDDKIELNRRMNETLVAMARALFKSWFVDFDPVRAKMEGRETGLPQEIADLFPDRLVESEIGEIPEGWEVFRLDQLAEHHTDSLSPLRSPESEYEHYSIPAYDAGQSPVIELGSRIKSNKVLVQKNSVLLSKLNPRIPRVWVPDHDTGLPQICSTEFLVFTPRPPANRSLLFGLFTEQKFRSLLSSMVTGTSRSHQRVPPKALQTQEVLAGTPTVFQIFGEAIEAQLTGVLTKRYQSRTLAALRETLLPQLISGELRLEEAASVSGEVP